jgi:hypothetical protein
MAWSLYPHYKDTYNDMPQLGSQVSPAPLRLINYHLCLTNLWCRCAAWPSSRLIPSVEAGPSICLLQLSHMTRVTSVTVAGVWPEGKLDKIDTCVFVPALTRFAYVSGCCFDTIHVNSLLDTSQGQHAWACVFVKLLTICDRGQACRRLVWVQFEAHL